MFKKLIVVVFAVLSFNASAATSPYEVCTSISEMGGAIVVARDQGLPLSKIYGIIQKLSDSEVKAGAVKIAEAVYEGSMTKQQVETQIFIRCMKTAQ